MEVSTNRWNKLSARLWNDGLAFYLSLNANFFIQFTLGLSLRESLYCPDIGTWCSVGMFVWWNNLSIRCGKYELMGKTAFVWRITDINISFSYLGKTCSRHSDQRQYLIAVWHLPSRSCSADFVSELSSLWLAFSAIFGFYFLSTFNKKPACCVLEYCLKLLLFNNSTEGFMLFCPFHRIVIVSVLVSHPYISFPPKKSYCSLQLYPSLLYRSRLILHILLILISLSVWSQPAPGYTIIYYKWQIWRRRSSAVWYLWLLYLQQMMVLWHSSAWVFLKSSNVEELTWSANCKTQRSLT